jgi:hypothetical protein
MIPTTTTTGAEVISSVVSAPVTSQTTITSTNLGSPSTTTTTTTTTPLLSPSESIANAIAGGQASQGLVNATTTGYGQTQANIYGSPTAASQSATQTFIDETNRNILTAVNLPKSVIKDGKVVPVIDPYSTFYTFKVGVQSTSALSRGYVKGSIIDLLNGNLDHVCDFKFIFPDLNSILAQVGLVNPVTAIRDAIKNAKLKATNTLRKLIQEAVTAIRTALNATITVLGLDATGIFSFNISALKAIAAQINSAVKRVAAAVEAVLEYVFLAQQIIQLINWIKTLPAKLQQLLQNCLNQFGASITQVANQIKSIPDQISSLTTSQLTNIANEFTQAGQLALDAANINTTNSSMPDAVAQAFSQPDSVTTAMSSTETIETSLKEHLAEKQSIISNYTATLMDPKTMTKSP